MSDAATFTANPAASLDPDVTIEQMAQVIAYAASIAAAETAFMTAQGYAVGDAIHGNHDLVMRAFTPQRAGLPGVVAFRGTVPSKIQTVLSDLDASGIGKDQFDGNSALIEKTLTAAGGGGRVIVTGHSLGGAVAQRAACGLPSTRTVPMVPSPSRRSWQPSTSAAPGLAACTERPPCTTRATSTPSRAAATRATGTRTKADSSQTGFRD